MSNVMEEHPIIRFLAAYEVNVDYSILAVMVCTLGLILVVELIRHHLDHKAESRPFFQAVLTSVYSECKSQEICWYVVMFVLSPNYHFPIF